MSVLKQAPLQILQLSLNSRYAVVHFTMPSTVCLRVCFQAARQVLTDLGVICWYVRCELGQTIDGLRKASLEGHDPIFKR